MTGRMSPQCGLCGAFIPRPPNDGTAWKCSSCGTEFDLPSAIVEKCPECDGSGVLWIPIQQRHEGEQ